MYHCSRLDLFKLEIVNRAQIPYNKWNVPLLWQRFWNNRSDANFSVIRREKFMATLGLLIIYVLCVSDCTLYPKCCNTCNSSFSKQNEAFSLTPNGPFFQNHVILCILATSCMVFLHAATRKTCENIMFHNLNWMILLYQFLHISKTGELENFRNGLWLCIPAYLSDLSNS